MTATTSTGHSLSAVDWLDDHFMSARPEYEDAARFVGVRAGSRVLDAGCGSGCFVPYFAEMSGCTGQVSALDLAPENISHIEKMISKVQLPPQTTAHVGSILSLPFDKAVFDCVWCANVVQYLSEAQFSQALTEFRRVTKPGGIVAIKEFDDSLVQFFPAEPDIASRFFHRRRENAKRTDVLACCGNTLPARLRAADLSKIRRKSWLVDRWAPLSDATRRFAGGALAHWAKLSEGFSLEEGDRAFWRGIIANPNKLIDDLDFCFREGFVVAVGSKD